MCTKYSRPQELLECRQLELVSCTSVMTSVKLRLGRHIYNVSRAFTDVHFNTHPSLVRFTLRPQAGEAVELKAKRGLLRWKVVSSNLIFIVRWNIVSLRQRKAITHVLTYEHTSYISLYLIQRASQAHVRKCTCWCWSVFFCFFFWQHSSYGWGHFLHLLGAIKLIHWEAVLIWRADQWVCGVHRHTPAGFWCLVLDHPSA